MSVSELGNLSFHLLNLVINDKIVPVLKCIGVASIFDWGGGGGANHKSHAIMLSKIFKKGTFVGPRYRRMEDLKQ